MNEINQTDCIEDIFFFIFDLTLPELASAILGKLDEYDTMTDDALALRGHFTIKMSYLNRNSYYESNHYNVNPYTLKEGLYVEMGLCCH